jgi:hypothetical protein
MVPEKVKMFKWYFQQKGRLSQSNDDGSRRRLVQTGLADQDVQLPAPGLYRLVFHAAQRCPLTYVNTYGRNPVRAWLAQSGATNVMCWTRVDDSVLVRREFLFPVAAADTYRFGLQGMADNSPECPGCDQNARPYRRPRPHMKLFRARAYPFILQSFSQHGATAARRGRTVSDLISSVSP